MSAARLYTPELLALAVDLARWPRIPDAALHGEARSPTCGSTLAMDLGLDPDGRIGPLGMTVRACAIGQASAAIFARSVEGRRPEEIAQSLARIEAWLAGEAPLPEWPGLAQVEPAQAYPARHGAMLLPWKAALAALSSTAPAS
jgi:NifU-like protein involved in Fe-S cluster formation